MKALLIIAHGSRNEEANEEVRRLAESIDDMSGQTFDKAVCAYLEITSPKVGSMITDLVASGMTEIAVFPYFLAAGTHVAHDVPQVIEEAGKAYPRVRFRILPHLGALEGLGELILRHIDRLMPID